MERKTNLFLSLLHQDKSQYLREKVYLETWLWMEACGAKFHDYSLTVLAASS